MAAASGATIVLIASFGQIVLLFCLNEIYSKKVPRQKPGAEMYIGDIGVPPVNSVPAYPLFYPENGRCMHGLRSVRLLCQ
jgi:hypothetical protein